jgi:exodeoxyribonuclease VII large subunit
MKKYKKSIPRMPKKVGILSSLEGAVVHDICNILKRRAPYIDIIIRNTKVNGIKSSEDLIKNFNDLVNYNNIDVIIIARGGGSFEDLSCFNNEKLVRNIFNCNIPIVSAVGHETDFTLCDFVSDIRASTPSEAAELVAINIDDLKQNLSNNIDKIVYSINQNIQKLSLVLSNYSKIIKSSNLKHIISNKHNNVHHLLDSIYNMIVSKIDKYYLKIEYNKNIIKNNDIDKIKNMGFSIIRKNNKVISDFNKINIDDDIDVDMKNGNFNATVRKVYGK